MYKFLNYIDTKILNYSICDNWRTVADKAILFPRLARRSGETNFNGKRNPV